MQIDFVKTPYKTWPSMNKNTGPIFNANPDPKYIEAKQIELSIWHGDLFARARESFQIPLIEQAQEYCGLKINGRLLDLGLSIEEDIAIMHNGILSVICFCFPSSWIPRERIGKSLTDIHRPVADGDRLVAMSKRLTDTMADPDVGSLRRHVWTITPNGRLSNHPGYQRPEFKSIEDLYFRVETQTTAPIGNNTSLFFVKVDVVPLLEVWDQKDVILESLNSMSDNILTYKNLHEIKKLLNNLGE